MIPFEAFFVKSKKISLLLTKKVKALEVIKLIKFFGALQKCIFLHYKV